MDLDQILEKLKNHKVMITKIGHEEQEMRETEGILLDFDKNHIHLKVWSSFGEELHYYLNRHAATLYSVIDLGVVK